MLAAPQKIDDEGRVFNSERCSKYLVVPRNQGVVSLVCQNMTVVVKEYNVKHHHTTPTKFDEIPGQE